MGVFDQLIANVDPADKAIFDKYPELKASVERLASDLSSVAQYAGEWLNWKNQNWDEEAGMTKAEKALHNELAAANARLAAFTSGSKGNESEDDLTALRKEMDAKLAEVQRQSLAAIEGMNAFYRAAARRVLTHQQEFGENFDPQALLDYMQKNRISDPDLAYDRMVANRRAEISAQKEKEREAKYAEEIKAAEQRGREQAAREAAMGPGGVLPTDHSGGIVGVTASMTKPVQIADEIKAKASKANLGDGTLAALGYEMFRRGELPVQ
jgi:hypothetical protein